MNYFVRFATLSVLVDELSFAMAQLTSVDNSPFVGQLYLEIGNDEPPTESEMCADPAMRNEICSQITNSPYFYLQNKKPIDMRTERIYKKLKRTSKYRALYDDVYEKTQKREYFVKRPRHHRYVNPYRLKPVRVDGLVDNVYLPVIPRREYVFLCLVKERKSKRKVAYQVSKEYNVFSGQTSQYVSGRFVFKPLPSSIQLVILAEEPAKAEPISNVEIYYLTLRRDRRLEKYARNDPICKLIPPQLALNQNHRICQSVLGSESFKDEVVYINRPQRRDKCSKREVFFQTPEGKREAARTGRYHEWMVYCLAKRIADNAEVNILVSRAYHSGQMFVYRMVSPNYRVYLDNLSTNVSIIDDGGKTVDDDDDVTDDSSPAIDNNDAIEEISEELFSKRL